MWSMCTLAIVVILTTDFPAILRGKPANLFFEEREGGNIQPSRETLNLFGITYVVKEEKSGLYIL